MFNNHHKRKKTAHEIHPEDIAQLIFGSCLLAVPVAFTEEVWRIGETIQEFNVGIIFIFSLFIIAVATFHTGYKHVVVTLEDWGYWKKVLSSYVVIFATVTFLLVMIEKAPWQLHPIVAFKRSIILALPASLSAVTADLIR